MKRSNIKRWLLAVVSIAILVALLIAIHRLTAEYHWRDIQRAIRSTSAATILLAATFAAASYLALTAFDALGLRYASCRVPYRRTALVSFMAYAFGHNVGLAAFSGAALRYRLYSTMGLGVVDVATVVGFCSVTSLLAISVVGGYGLLTEPQLIASAVHMHSDLISGVGVVVLVLVATYLSWAILARQAIELPGWSLRPPGIRIALPQVIVGVLDITLAGTALWMLLPIDARPALPAFCGVYAAAVFVGIVSTVPAGIGVFEYMMLFLLPNIPGPQLLGCLLIYRLVYYIAPLVIATALFAIVEIGKQRAVFGRVNALASIYIKPIAPQLAGVLIFISGAVLLASGATPAMDERLHQLHRFVPLPILEVSHLVGSVVGLALLIIARGLFRRLSAAYHVTFWLLVAGAMASLLKGFDYEEASLLALVLLVLYWGRAAFYRPAKLVSLRFSPPWLISILVVIAMTTWLAFFAHHHVEYSNELWWSFGRHADASRVLRAVLVTGVLASAVIAMNWLAPAPIEKSTLDQNDVQRVIGILQKSTDSLANVVLALDKRVMFHPEGDAFIMYQVTKRSYVALGDPIGTLTRQEELVWQFRELCDLHGAQTVFYQVTPECLPLYVDLGLSLVKLGEEARVPLSDFSLEGSARAELRHAKRRAERDGAAFGFIPADNVVEMLPQLRTVSNAWLEDKTAGEKGFSIGSFNDEYMVKFPVAVVRAEGSIVAFANVWSSGDGTELSVDLMRFMPDAPRSAMDFLFIELMLWGKREGYQWFNLGSAPLSGLETHALAPAWHRVGNLVYRYADQFYNFDGLRRYKQKFQPVWRPRYLAFPGGLSLPRVLLDVSTLISGGVRELVTK